MVVQGWGSLQANHLSTWCVVGAGQCMAWQVRHMDTADRAMREVCTWMLTLKRGFQLSCCAAWACLHVEGLQVAFLC